MTEDDTDVISKLTELPDYPTVEPVRKSHYDHAAAQDVTPNYIPERGLLAAILEMAVRDLGPTAQPNDRKSAINWFLKKNRNAIGFSFSEVANYLELGVNEIKIIHAKVEASQDYEITRLEKFRNRSPFKCTS